MELIRGWKAFSLQYTVDTFMKGHNLESYDNVTPKLSSLAPGQCVDSAFASEHGPGGPLSSFPQVCHTLSPDFVNSFLMAFSAHSCQLIFGLNHLQLLLEIWNLHTAKIKPLLLHLHSRPFTISLKDLHFQPYFWLLISLYSPPPVGLCGVPWGCAESLFQPWFSSLEILFFFLFDYLKPGTLIFEETWNYPFHSLQYIGV